jgi:alkylhydroperoxidase family enzyme
MSRFPPVLESATGATAEIYAQIMEAAGNVPNTFATIGVHGAAALQADSVRAASPLSQQDQETVTWLSSAVAGCDDGVAAHRRLGQRTGRAPEGLTQMRAGQPTGDAKRDALGRFGRNLAETRGTISAEECSAIKAADDTAQHLVESSLASAGTVCTNGCHRRNDTAIGCPTVA